MKEIQELTNCLSKFFKLDLRHLDFLAKFITAIIIKNTVNLKKNSNAFYGKAKEESNYKRIQRFFQIL